MTTDAPHALQEFEALVHPLLGQKVSLPWQGYGSAIFLELGQLQPLETGRQRHNMGEACISVEWDWRVEHGAAVLYGSANSRPEIERGIRSLLNAEVRSLSLEGAGPELAVHFSNGDCLRSMLLSGGDPRWSIRLPGGEYLQTQDGALLVGGGVCDIDEAAAEAQAYAGRTAARWGVPLAGPAPGQCAHCASFVRIDGDYDFLGYGVCTETASPFDGRAVNCQSGCPVFGKAGQ